MTTQATIVTPVADASPPGSVAMGLLSVGAIGVIVSFGIAVMNLMEHGHGAFNANSLVPWGLPVSTYVFFVLSSTGLTFVASLGMVFGFPGFVGIAKRCVWLAVCTLVAGFACLSMEIGHPFRMLWSLGFAFQFDSPLWWMGAFYLSYLALLLVKLYYIHSGDWSSPTSKWVGIASFVAVIAAHGTLGVVFGVLPMRPFWYGTLIPAYFLTTAFLSGTAFAFLFTHLAYGFRAERIPQDVRNLLANQLSWLFAALIIVIGIFTMSRTFVGLWSNQEGMEVFHLMVKSPLFLFEIVIGLGVPLLIMFRSDLRQKAGMQVLAACLVLLSLFIGRYEFVVGAQIVPLFKGTWFQDFVPYTPSFTEWMLTLLAVSLTVCLFGLGEKALRLSDKP